MLIVFEGLDQSGKETQARLLRERLQQDGRTLRSLSFPEYETPIGRELRQALDGQRDFPADVMQLLYVANRLEFASSMEQWLAAGDIVICDSLLRVGRSRMARRRA
jgi:dTMP kinase